VKSIKTILFWALPCLMGAPTIAMQEVAEEQEKAEKEQKKS
jgi:hypothetical protein